MISDDFNSLPSGAPLSDDADWDVHIAAGSGVPTMDQHDDHSDGSQVVDMSTTGDAYCVFETDIGADDHWCELDVFIDVDPSSANVCGPIVRGSGTFGSGDFNGYAAWGEGLALGGGTSSIAVRIYRIDDDVPTQLADTGDISASYDPGNMHRVRIEVEDDALTAFIDGDEVLSTTDATYSVGQRCGFRHFREEATTFSQPFVDNFEGDVLAVVNEIDPPTIDSTAVVGEPSASLELSPAVVPSTATAGEPSIGLELSPATIASTAEVNEPTVTLELSPPLIGSTAQVNEPTVSQPSAEIDPPTITSTAVVGEPTLTLELSPPTIASTAQVNEPTLATGALFNMEVVALSPVFRSRSASAPLFRARTAVAPEFANRESGEPAFRERSSDTVFAAREAEPPTFLTGEQNG